MPYSFSRLVFYTYLSLTLYEGFLHYFFSIKFFTFNFFSCHSQVLVILWGWSGFSGDPPVKEKRLKVEETRGTTQT